MYNDRFAINPRLVVVDLDQLNPTTRRDLMTTGYSGVLGAETLSHLAACARAREAAEAEKLASMLGVSTIGAYMSRLAPR